MCACVHACWDGAGERCYFCSLPRKHAGTQCDRQHHTNNNEVAVLPTRRHPSLHFPLPVSLAGWDRTGWGQRWGRPLPRGELQGQHRPFWGPGPPRATSPPPRGCRHSQAPKHPQVGGQQRGRELMPPPAALPQCHPGARPPVLSNCWDTHPVPVPTGAPGQGVLGPHLAAPAWVWADPNAPKAPGAVTHGGGSAADSIAQGRKASPEAAGVGQRQPACPAQAQEGSRKGSERPRVPASPRAASQDPQAGSWVTAAVFSLQSPRLRT